MKKIAIKGSKIHEEQKEIIKILESLGGKNKYNFIGDTYLAYYYINSNNNIAMTSITDHLKDYVLLTLEQYKEKYKYMENKELQIIAPEGYEIDKDNSTFEKIVFKKVEEKLTYEDIAEKLFIHKKHYYTNDCGTIREIVGKTKNTVCCIDPNNAPTYNQLARLLALNKLMNVAYYFNDGWKSDWEDDLQPKFCICYNHKSNTIRVDSNIYINNGVVYFKSKELAGQAVKILGEETIKLALGVL